MFDILAYRLFRNRRVILLGLIPALATLSAVQSYTGQANLLWLVIGLAVPVWHALIYPNNWTETLAVSVATSACVVLAAIIPPDLETGALFMRYFWLVLGWFAIFFVLVWPFSLLGVSGPVSCPPIGAAAVSRLDAETLKAAMTYYPGRKDNRVICGPADEDGRFPVTLRQEFTVLSFEDEAASDRHGVDADGVLENHGTAVVHSTGPDHHEIFYFEDATTVTACNFRFIDLGDQGTRIVIEEVGTPLHAGQWFGMWISDYLADYLTDHIDAAEGRAPRANRAFRHKQLVVDLANVIVPVLNALNGQSANTPKR